jgi:inhibitor of KinA sporulation pathway (predicted exonuclease)
VKKFIIVDLEWTSWKGNYLGKNFEIEKRKNWQKKEIIQIGAIKFNKYYKILDTLNLYVKPHFNPILSNYITNLTNITNKLIEKKGLKFIKANKELIKFSKDCTLLSNGIDGQVLKKNYHYNKINLKCPEIINIKKIFEKEYHIPKKFLHSPKIKTFFGYKYRKEEAHNALNDCKSVLFAIKKMKFDLENFKK